MPKRAKTIVHDGPPPSAKPDVDVLLNEFVKQHAVDHGVGAARLSAGGYLHGFTDALVLVRIRMSSMSVDELRQFILREEMRGKLLGTDIGAGASK